VAVVPAFASSQELRKTPTVSLCMIVRNEERVLGDCLASAKLWVDEIILVDTGSTDRTVEIAEEQGAKVHYFPWCDDFSAARNVSLSHATGDWLFWMDADDTLPEACGQRIRELVFLAPTETAGYLMQVHIPPAPGENGFTIVDHVKLFRNRPEFRFEGHIHEQILDAIGRVGGRVERTDLYVVHSGYDYSPEGQKRKRERDWPLLEKDIAARPEHPFGWFNFGMTAFRLKEYELKQGDSRAGEVPVARQAARVHRAQGLRHAGRMPPRPGKSGNGA
jgi:O-antigen biosynthesis protein